MAKSLLTAFGAQKKPDDKVYAYTIYHLDHHRLMSMSREKPPQDEEVMRYYQRLLSNRPRADKSLKQHFRLGAKTLQDSVDEIHRDSDLINERKITRKAKSALSLLKRGWYKPVAKVDAVCAQHAIMATVSVNTPWMQKKQQHVKVLKHAWRSTESYDIVKRFDEYFLKMPLGFIDLQNQMYSDELV